MDIQIPGITDETTTPIPSSNPTTLTGGESGGAPSPMDVSKLSKQELMNIMSQAQALNLDPRSMIGAKFILSICPWPLQTERFHHGDGLRYYAIPGVRKGDHFVLPVFNTYTTIMDSSRSEEEITSNAGRSFFTQRTIMAQHLCDDLIKHWAGDHPANKEGGQLGIMQIRSKIPTHEELQAVNHMQNKFFRNLAGQAHGFHIQGKPQNIHFEHYRAAEYLGLSPKEHPWVISQTNAEPTISCYSCQSNMPRDAYKCPVCREDNAQIYFEMQLPADKSIMPGIANRLKFLIDKYLKKAEEAKKVEEARKAEAASPTLPTPIIPTPIIPTPIIPTPTGAMGLKK